MLRKRLFSDKEKADIRILIKFVSIYCRENHKGAKTVFAVKGFDMKDVEKGAIALCADCARLLRYAFTMRLKCPHDPKPMCKKCETQCYTSDYRSRMREIMKFSGMHLIKHGRLDMLYHYFK